MSAAPPLTSQVIGQAENAHLPLLERVLGRSGITFPQWVALTIAAAADTAAADAGVADGAIDRGELIGRMTGALKIDDAAAARALAGLTVSELLQDLAGDGSRVGLTDTGRARHHQVRAAVDQVVARLYGNIPAEDLATTSRVLTLITARANAELGVS
jgi:DNA-binding MarR family transcriptional regulator